jgi:small subunit ribosomal protein S21
LNVKSTSRSAGRTELRMLQRTVARFSPIGPPRWIVLRGGLQLDAIRREPSRHTIAFIPGAWHEIGTILQVLVRDNNVDQALRVLKKKMQREGIFREMKARKAYEKPSERKTREKAEAIRRARKAARKKAQREGLLPAPKKRVQDARGRPGALRPAAAIA